MLLVTELKKGTYEQIVLGTKAAWDSWCKQLLKVKPENGGFLHWGSAAVTDVSDNWMHWADCMTIFRHHEQVMKRYFGIYVHLLRESLNEDADVEMLRIVSTTLGRRWYLLIHSTAIHI